MNPRGYVTFGSDIGFPDPAPPPTAASALADYQKALAIQKTAEARSLASPGDPGLSQAAQAAKSRADQAYRIYVQLANRPAPPLTSASAFRIWQRAVQQHASPGIIAIYKRTYERLAAAEKKAGQTPFVPTGGVGPDGQTVDIGSTSFRDVLVVAALTAPAWGQVLWGMFRR